MASALGKEGRQIAHSFSCNGFKTISVFTRYIDRCLSLSVASNTELINDHKNIRSNQKKALDATYSSGSEKKNFRYRATSIKMYFYGFAANCFFRASAGNVRQRGS